MARNIFSWLFPRKKSAPAAPEAETAAPEAASAAETPPAEAETAPAHTFPTPIGIAPDSVTTSADVIRALDEVGQQLLDMRFEDEQQNKRVHALGAELQERSLTSVGPERFPYPGFDATLTAAIRVLPMLCRSYSPGELNGVHLSLTQALAARTGPVEYSQRFSNEMLVHIYTIKLIEIKGYLLEDLASIAQYDSEIRSLGELIAKGSKNALAQLTTVNTQRDTKINDVQTIQSDIKNYRLALDLANEALHAHNSASTIDFGQLYQMLRDALMASGQRLQNRSRSDLMNAAAMEQTAKEQMEIMATVEAAEQKTLDIQTRTFEFSHGHLSDLIADALQPQEPAAEQEAPVQPAEPASTYTPVFTIPEQYVESLKFESMPPA